MVTVRILLPVTGLFLLYIGSGDRCSLLDAKWSRVQWGKCVLLYTAFIMVATRALVRHWQTKLPIDEGSLEQECRGTPTNNQCENKAHVKPTQPTPEQGSKSPVTATSEITITQNFPDEDETVLLKVMPSEEEGGELDSMEKLKEQFRKILLQAKPKDILPALRNILSATDIDKVKEITEKEGDRQGTALLVKRLEEYDQDFSSTLKALEDPGAGMRAKRTGRKLREIKQQWDKEDARQKQRDIDRKIAENKELMKKVEHLKELEDERYRLQQSLRQNGGDQGLHGEQEDENTAEAVRSELKRIDEEIEDIQTDLSDHDERLGKCEKGAGQMKTAINWTIKELEKEKKTVSQQQDQQSILEGFVKEYVKDTPYSGAKFNTELQKRIRTDFKNYVDPDIVLDLFPKYNLEVLNQQDMERVQAVRDFYGPTRGAIELLERLVKYEEWFDCLLEVLRDPEVSREDLADTFMEAEQEILKEQEAQKGPLSGKRKEFVIWLIGMSRHKKGERAYKDGQRNAFHTLTDPWSVSHTVQLAWAEIDDVILKVVDVPIPDESSACSNFAEAMSLCPEGFHSLLLVFRSEDAVMDEAENSIHMLKQQFGDDIISSFVVVVLITEMKLGDDWLERQDNKLKELLTGCFFLYNLYSADHTNNPEARTSINFRIPETNVMDLLRYVRWQKHKDIPYTNEHFDEARTQVERILAEDRESPQEETMRETCLVIRNLNLLERPDLDLDQIGVILMRIQQNMKRLFSEVKDAEPDGLQKKLKEHLVALEKSLERENDISKRNKKLQEQYKKQRDDLIEKMKTHHGIEETRVNTERWIADRNEGDDTQRSSEATDREERINFCYQTKMKIIKETQQQERDHNPDKTSLRQTLQDLNDDYTRMRKTQREKMRETIGRLIVRLKEQ